MADTKWQPPTLVGPAFKADPYLAYAELRTHRPIYCRPSSDGSVRTWFFTRYTDVAAVLRDHQRFVKDVHAATPMDRPLDREPNLYRLLTKHMLNADGATHARLRGLVNKAFSARKVEQLAPRIQIIAEKLLDQVADAQQFDVVDDYALPLAVEVIATVLGIEPHLHDRFRAWSKILVAPSASIERNTRKTAKLGRVMEDFAGYLRRICMERQRSPRDDLITMLLRAAESGNQLSEAELYSMVLLISVVGHETSVYMIADAVRTLLEEPAALEILRANPQLLPQAIEELIRFDGPVERATMRFAAETVTMGDQTIHRGDAVSLVLASAHRDGSAFCAPDRLDLLRGDNQHLGFGLGVHYCLGASLARLEGQIAISSLFRRFPNLHLAVPSETLRWHANPILRGPRHLPVSPQ